MSFAARRAAFEEALLQRCAPDGVSEHRGRSVLWVDESTRAKLGTRSCSPTSLPPGAVAGSWADEDASGAVSVLLAVAGGEDTPDVFAFTGPVDVVYTWVDGRDPAWRSRRDERRAALEGAPLHRTATSAGRFENHDELRYSLRSLEYYAPWVRTIYIVTDRQRPAWLSEDPRVQIVDHSALLPARCLPTFNSHAIETSLHLIPGLAEHFLYFNDDVFLGRPAEPEDFFTPAGQSLVFPSEQGISGDLPVMRAARNNAELIASLTGRTVRRRYRHTPHPQRVSTSLALEDAAGPRVEDTREHPFRHPDDLSFASSLVLSYGCATGAAVPADIGYLYVDFSGGPTQLLRLAKSSLLRRRPHTVCFNQVGEMSSLAARLMARALRSRWPWASSWER